MKQFCAVLQEGKTGGNPGPFTDFILKTAESQLT